MADQDFDNPENWARGWDVDDEPDRLGANYLADDCTVRCGLCDRRVLDDGRCPDCDNGYDDSLDSRSTPEDFDP